MKNKQATTGTLTALGTLMVGAGVLPQLANGSSTTLSLLAGAGFLVHAAGGILHGYSITITPTNEKTPPSASTPNPAP